MALCSDFQMRIKTSVVAALGRKGMWDRSRGRRKEEI